MKFMKYLLPVPEAITTSDIAVNTDLSFLVRRKKKKKKKKLEESSRIDFKIKNYEKFLIFLDKIKEKYPDSGIYANFSKEDGYIEFNEFDYERVKERFESSSSVEII